MSAIGDFFSGGESKSGPKQQSMLTPEVMELLKKYTAQATAGGPAATTPFQTYAGVQPAQQSMIDFVSSLKDNKNFQAVLQGLPAFQRDSEKTTSDFMKYEQPGMQSLWEKNVGSKIPEIYAGSGFWGNARADALASAREDEASREQGVLGGRIREDTVANDLARTQAFDRMTGANTSYAGMQAGAGGVQQNAAEQKIASELARWTGGETVNGVSNPYASPAMQLGLRLMGFSPFTYQNVGTSTGPGMGAGFAQGAGQGFGKSLDGTGVLDSLFSGIGNAWDWLFNSNNSNTNKPLQNEGWMNYEQFQQTQPSTSSWFNSPSDPG